MFNNYQLQDTITYTTGAHTIRAGVDMMRQIAKQFVPFNAQGTLTFSAGGGFPVFGNFVDGFSGTQGTFAAITFGEPVDHPNAFQQAYFINDSWRVKPNLSLNLGLRYENYGTRFNVVPFPDAPITFLLMARLVGAKGIREYAAAAAEIRRSHPETRFLLAGGSEGNRDSIHPSELAAWERDGTL